MSDSLWPHGLQHARPPVHHQLPEPTQTHVHGVGDAIQPSHPLLSPSSPTFNLPQRASWSFPMSGLFKSGGQNIGASASASVLPMNIQDWFLLGLTGVISLQSKILSRVFSSTTVWKHQFFGAQSSFGSNSHIHIWLLEKIIALTTWIFVSKVMSLLFNTLSWLLIAFLPKCKCIWILWL